MAAFGHGIQAGIDALHVRDQARFGREIGVGRIHAIAIGEQNQQVSLDSVGHHGGQAIVLAHLDLVGGHRVVLVDDGNDGSLQEALERVSQVEIAPPVLYILARHQHLGHHEIIDVKVLLPKVHQPSLAHRRQHLLERDALALFGITQPLAAGLLRT